MQIGREPGGESYYWFYSVKSSADSLGGAHMAQFSLCANNSASIARTRWVAIQRATLRGKGKEGSRPDCDETLTFDDLGKSEIA